MISRRKVLQMLAGLPLGGLVVNGMAGIKGHAKPAGTGTIPVTAQDLRNGKSIYSSVGARPLINARGTVTVIGATRILPEVEQAMKEATRDYVQLDELMDGVGSRLGELTGAEWGIVTCGASAAITVGTAGCVTGGDPDKLWQVPDLTGMKDEVIIPSYSRSAYDSAARAVGVKMVEVSNLAELKEALGPQTAMIMIMAGSYSEDGPLSLQEISEKVKPQGIPILVDAAAEELAVPNPHIAKGADLVTYSGGKCLRGPQCAGLLIGRKDLVKASWVNSAPHHGFGRGFKVGREEIMGMLAAVEMWFQRNHAGEQEIWTNWLKDISESLEQVRGVSTEIRQPRGRSNRTPSLHVEWDQEIIPLTGNDVEQILWDGEPRIAVSGAGSFLPFPPNMRPNISITPYQLKAGEVRIIADRVLEILTTPPAIHKPDTSAAFDLSGQWDLEMNFTASTVNQTLIIEQTGSELIGTHTASYASRNLSGTLNGHNILIRSSYTDKGVRLNYEFTGIVNESVMEGNVSMGEYGIAGWKAKRHEYHPPGSR